MQVLFVRGIRFFVGLWAGIGVLVPAIGRTEEGVTSLAIDPTIYREGAIRRTSGAAGAWSYVCDEVRKQHHKFCSLRTLLLDGDGRTIGRLTVSTGEDGRPAAVLELAEALSLGHRVVASIAPAEGKIGPAFDVPATVAACTVDVCQHVWTLPPAHVAALNNGGLAVRVSSQLFATKPGGDPSDVTIAVRSDGFSAALAASLKPSAD